MEPQNITFSEMTHAELDTFIKEKGLKGPPDFKNKGEKVLWIQEQITPSSSNENNNIPTPPEQNPIQKTSITILVTKDIPFGPKMGTRTFTLEQHGEKFKEAAESYRVRWNGVIVE
jgi:hypothetical protein